jgi:hypothetical protein
MARFGAVCKPFKAAASKCQPRQLQLCNFGGDLQFLQQLGLSGRGGQLKEVDDIEAWDDDTVPSSLADSDDAAAAALG